MVSLVTVQHGLDQMDYGLDTIVYQAPPAHDLKEMEPLCQHTDGDRTERDQELKTHRRKV